MPAHELSQAEKSMLETLISHLQYLKASGATSFDITVRTDRVNGLIPHQLFEITSLTTLRLASYRIASLGEIGKLTRLTSLILDNNELEALPEDITALQSLHTLSIAYNRVSKFPPLYVVSSKLHAHHLLTSSPEELSNRLQISLSPAIASTRFQRTSPVSLASLLSISLPTVSSPSHLPFVIARHSQNCEWTTTCCAMYQQNLVI